MGHSLPEELWDIDELASYLKVGRRFIYRLTAERRIRFLRIGGQLRFDPRDVASYLESEALAPEVATPARRMGRPRKTGPKL